MYNVSKNNLKSVEADDDKLTRSIKSGFRPHRRFFVDFEIGDEKRISLTDEGILHQLVFVFRVKLGDDIVLLDNSGFEFNGTVKGISKKEILIHINERRAGKSEVPVQVSVFQSLIKKDNVELVFEKCTEMGVARLAPILARNSVKLNLNFDRIKKIMTEASEQSGRTKLPQLEEIKDFEAAVILAKNENGAVNFIFHEENDACCDKLSCGFLSHFKDNKIFNIFIGPEGGFTNEEIEFAKNNGFYILSLGNLVLRSETAALTACFMIINK